MSLALGKKLSLLAKARWGKKRKEEKSNGYDVRPAEGLQPQIALASEMRIGGKAKQASHPL